MGRFRFGVRALLIGVVIIGVSCAWAADRLRRIHHEEAAVAFFRSRSAYVWQDNVLPGSFRYRVDKVLGIPWFTRPTDLHFHPGSQVNDEDLARLSDIPSLKVINLKSLTLITDSGFRHLLQLEDLSYVMASHSTLTDEGLSYLSRIEQLKALQLNGTRITDAGLASLVVLSNLSSLDVGQTAVTGEGIARVRSLPLEHLGVNDCEIDDEGLCTISSLSRLTSLDLAQTKISDEGIVHLAQLHDLVRLNLSGTNITNASLRKLVTLTRLRQLDLRATNISEEDVRIFVAERPNCNVLIGPIIYGGIIRVPNPYMWEK